MITAGIILLIYFASKGVRDRIRFRPDDFWFIRNLGIRNWVLGIDKYGYQNRTWLTKYVFSFLADGWHFFDSVCVLCLCIGLTLCTNLPIYCALVFYFGGGVVFEMAYNIKLR